MSENKNSFLTFQKSIDIKQLFFESIRRWYIIVITLAVSVIIAFVYTKVFMTPLYSSVAKVMIFNKTTTSSSNDMELSASTYLTRDFTEIINDKCILSPVANELDNKYTHSQIKNFISVNNPANTRIIEITASTPNAEDSQKIVNTICDVAKTEAVEIMGLDRINLISYGDVAKKPSSPNLSRNIFTALLLGLVLSLSIVVILYITDNKVSSTEDVEKYLGLSVLATIPYNNKNHNSKRKYTSSK